MALRSCSRCCARQPASRTPSTPTSDRCAHTARARGGEKLAAAISPPEPLRTFLEELTRGRGPAVQVGVPRAALHAIIAAEVLTPATRSAYAGRWVGKQYGARGNSATWMHEAPEATGTKGRTDSD